MLWIHFANKLDSIFHYVLPCPDSTFHETNMALEKLGFEDAFLADSFGEGFPMSASC